MGAGGGGGAEYSTLILSTMGNDITGGGDIISYRV